MNYIFIKIYLRNWLRVLISINTTSDFEYGIQIFIGNNRSQETSVLLF